MPKRAFLLALSLALSLVACGDDKPGRDADSTTDAADTTDARETTDVEVVPDVPDSDDARDVDAPDGIEVRDSDDASDTDDVPDAPDTDDVPDVSDTDDVPDAPDTDDVPDAEVTTFPDGCDPDTGSADTAADSSADTNNPNCEFPRDPDDGAFDDHAITEIESIDCFFAWAGASAYDPVLVKFTIPDFNANDAPVRFYQNGFYQLHDEWYWFRLLNGHAIQRLSGDPLAVPVSGMSFASIPEIYDTFANSSPEDMPFDLRWLPDHSRLYSKHFYDLAGFTTDPIPRFFGVGTVVHYAPEPNRRLPDEIWGFEMEFVEKPTVASVERYFNHLARVLPAEISDRLIWISRSPAQDSRAAEIRAGSGPFKNRVATYDDLVIDGEVKIYNAGVAAGIVHVMPDEFSLADISSDEIVVIPRVPDDIPPTRAIVSAVPQTALAHVNLLAKSRGTPNAYVGGIMQWGQLANWDYYRQPIIIEMVGDEGGGEVRWHPMTSDQYTEYKSKISVPVRHIGQVEDLASAPYSVSLTDGGTADMAELVPLTGGKCAGFLSFLDVPGMETPESPMCITVRAYLEHVAEFIPMWRAMTQQQDFATIADARFLLLEGRDAFDEENAADAGALAWRENFEAIHQNDVLGLVLSKGGVQRMIREKPVAPTTLQLIRDALTERYDFLAETQGLRFRSSSTAEDVIGFNGAGLHDSNTGFLDPSKARDSSDRHKSIEWAMKKTWASYWNFNAFEERRVGNLDHFEGSMALAVHARFDDDKELANGVVTHFYTTYTDVPHHRFVLNIQAGPTAVTNPGGSLAKTEIDEVAQVGDEPPVIRRMQRSDLISVCEQLVSDEELLAMFELSKTHTILWLDVENSRRPFAERNKTIVIDMEMKRMAAGWPELVSGEIKPARLLWRQSRVLDSPPVVRAVSDPFLPGPFPITDYMPHDLRTVAERVVVDSCHSEYFDIRVYKIYSAASATELFPFADVPYVYKAFVKYLKDAPGFDWPTTAYWLPRGSMTTAVADPATGTQLTFSTGTANTLGTDSVTITPADAWTIKRGDATVSGTCVSEQRSPYQSPAEYLRGILLGQ